MKFGQSEKKKKKKSIESQPVGNKTRRHKIQVKHKL